MGNPYTKSTKPLEQNLITPVFVSFLHSGCLSRLHQRPTQQISHFWKLNVAKLLGQSRFKTTYEKKLMLTSKNWRDIWLTSETNRNWTKWNKNQQWLQTNYKRTFDTMLHKLTQLSASILVYWTFESNRLHSLLASQTHHKLCLIVSMRVLLGFGEPIVSVFWINLIKVCQNCLNITITILILVRTVGYRNIS